MIKKLNTDLFRFDLVPIEDGMFEVKDLPKGNYDGQAVQYDKLISNPLYNRIMWGNSPKEYTKFCREGVHSNKKGIMVDLGCGTLSYTFSVYADHLQKDLYLCDLSYEMLKIGKDRLFHNTLDESNLTFLRSDAFNMPFVDNSVETILCFGIFHVFENPGDLMLEIKRILSTEGQFYLTSLCKDRSISSKYLNVLNQKGHVAKPLHSEQIKSIIESAGLTITQSKVTGGMAYFVGKI